SYMFYLNWKLTASIFLILPLILLFLKYISKTIKVHSIKGQEGLEKITSTIKESLDGVRIIQSFNLEKEMSNRFHGESQEFLHSRKKIHKRVEMSGPVTEFVVACVSLGIFTYMGLEISAGRATLGDFGGYLVCLLGLSPPVKKLQESYVRIQETIVAADRAYSILENPGEVPQGESTKPFPKDWKTITYQNVNFSYGAERILKNVNLTIHRGEMVAFVGSSGSGKSTMVNLLERFFDPTQGEILIDQTPIREINLKDLRANIALVTQDVFLFSDTIERNIWAGDFSKTNEGVIPAAKSANAHNFITRTPKGYQNQVGDRGNLLSGGEKQRISIARAIFKDAPILILDEATSALDSQSEVEVQKGLDHLMQGKTALVIAHRLSTVSKAHKIIVMRAGEIVEIGTHQSLLQNAGEYHSLHQLQKL
ncbi:MAG: ABC transporter ATP-binding protein, partial [Pseudobdellovibrionaceae bacterium]